ncbi:SAM-dependent methyltransferase [Ferrovibrio sp.]|uniref:SAM-dependent methyltransferase n=1 Tax=Ferrovibrio sp. TaxID=1917215 RepID=UPI00311F4E38
MTGGPAPGPSPWIVRFAPLAAPGGSVLDLACGGGRHGRLFLAAGHPVCFLDRDLAGIADLQGAAGAELLAADLEGAPWPLPAARRFDAIVVANYLWRPLFPDLIAALAANGLLLYETFMRGNERIGRPTNPDYLLAPGELFERLKDSCDILAFEQGWQDAPGPAMRQRICARKR